MVRIAEAINSFLPTEQQAVFPVSPLEEPVFILTSGQLQEIISQAIAQALEERLEALPEAQIGQEKLLQVIEAQALEIRALNCKLEAQAERLETLEKLEQLRALALGGRMVVLDCDAAGIGVDSPADVPKTETWLRQAGLLK